MNNINLSIILIIISFSNILSQSDTLLNEDQAIRILITKIQNDSVYSAWTKTECMHFFTDEIMGEHFIVTIRENHNEDCPGSPLTTPRIDTFKILRNSKEVLWYNLPDDKYEDYNEFLKIRKKHKR